MNPGRLAPGFIFLTTMIFYKKREKRGKKKKNLRMRSRPGERAGLLIIK